MRNYFNYTCTLETIPQIANCMSTEDVLANMLIVTGQPELMLGNDIRQAITKRIAEVYLEVVHKTLLICRRSPSKVLFFFPDAANGSMCVIAHATNGRCYLFTSDHNYASHYQQQGCKVRIW